MKKRFPERFSSLVQLFIKATRLKDYAVITVVLLTGCTATVVRWNSVRMREEIMAYYNDEIMDNLIKMKEGLPFLHVDISSVSAQGISQVSGTVGSGDTESVTRTSPSMMGALHTITRVATAPFAYSVTPLHNDTLTMTAVPVIGPLSSDSQTTSKTTTKTEITKPIESDPKKDQKSVTTITAEEVPKPTTTTIYKVYETYGKCLVDDPTALVFSPGPIRPNKDTYVPGTLKWHGSGYYYIGVAYKEKYRQLCMSLFTQSRGKATDKGLRADVDLLKAQSVLPTTRSP